MSPTGIFNSTAHIFKGVISNLDCINNLFLFGSVKIFIFIIVLADIAKIITVDYKDYWGINSTSREDRLFFAAGYYFIFLLLFNF